jgi:hypothetical protein
MKKRRTSAGLVSALPGLSDRGVLANISCLEFGVTMTGNCSHLGSQVLTGETILDSVSSHRGFVEADFIRRTRRSCRRAGFRHRVFMSS